MIFQWLRSVIGARQEARRTRRIMYVNDLTERYHVFRSLLDTNNLSVELLTELDSHLCSRSAVGEMRGKILRLLDLTGELVEKLNYLDRDRHEGLFKVQRQIEEHLLGLVDTLPEVKTLPFYLALDEINPEMQQAVGNKASALARQKKSTQYPVPDGFVITVRGCRTFLNHNGLYARLVSMLRQSERDGRFALEVVEQVREAIMAAPIPPEIGEALERGGSKFFDRSRGLAVRSSSRGEDSATHSFAGQFATVLNVVDSDGLRDAFRRVTASYFNSRSLAYRKNAGLDPLDFDMAVLCLEMVQARSAGVLLTRNPLPGDEGAMLISAVYGLGEAAVGGSCPADVYLVDRKGAMLKESCVIAHKQEQLVCLPEGGVATVELAEEMRDAPVLDEDHLVRLLDWGAALEREASGCPRDVEWAVTEDDEMILLQVRPQIIDRPPGEETCGMSGPLLLSGGVRGSSGLAVGRVRVIANRGDLEALKPEEPTILVMHQSLVDAVAVMDGVDGIVVDLGNPADHLALVARESGVPLVCGLGDATRRLNRGQWVCVNGSEGTISMAMEGARESAIREKATKRKQRVKKTVTDPLCDGVRKYIVPLNLTDAYGPTFTIMECRSLHDIIRYAHEKAVLAMFEAGDNILEKGGTTIHVVESMVPFHVNLIDLGGGLARGEKRRFVPPSAILSTPFIALWEGVSTPGLRWGPPPGAVNIGSVMSRYIIDQRSARPVGMPNYAIISRDYLNLNARMDFHFVMIDALCGLTSRSNYVRFRFKGGGTSAGQCQRRAACIAGILEAEGFFTDVRGDLVNGTIQGVTAEHLAEKLVVLGRLLGFTRLLDAAMRTDEMVAEMVRAFQEGDFALTRFETQ